jgi:hypothetical protein
MRTSRVVLAGIAVAATAATTSAFTASNTFTNGAVKNDVAGYGEITVTGTQVQDIAYVADTQDNTYLDHVVFTLGTDVHTQAVTMTLKKAKTGGVAGYDTVSTPYTCDLTSYVADTSTVETCSVSDHGSSPRTVLFESFDTVGLTVTHPTTS